MATKISRKSAKVAKKSAAKRVARKCATSTSTRTLIKQADPGLFNSSLAGNTRRAIDFHEGDEIDEIALQALIRAAVALNIRSQKKPRSA